MNKRFLIPGLCALCLHAALLLGFRSGNGVAIKNHLNKDEPPSVTIVPFEPPVVDYRETEKSSADDEPVLGNTTTANPSSPEPPPMDVTRDVFTTPTHPVVSADKIDTSKVIIGIVGVPHGVADGIKLTSEVFDSTKLDRRPRALSQVSPLYPAEARMRGVGAEVMVEFSVDENGRVATMRIVSSSDHGFDRAALEAVRKWRFEPGRRNGRIVRFSMMVPVVFRLNND